MIRGTEHLFKSTEWKKKTKKKHWSPGQCPNKSMGKRLTTFSKVFFLLKPGSYFLQMRNECWRHRAVLAVNVSQELIKAQLLQIIHLKIWDVKIWIAFIGSMNQAFCSSLFTWPSIAVTLCIFQTVKLPNTCCKQCVFIWNKTETLLLF